MPLAITVIVLAGGESRRMGRDKRAVPVGDRPLLRRALDLAAGASDDVILSCRAADPPPAEALAGIAPRVVFDRMGAGPLAGVESGLVAAAHDVCVVIPVDMPRLSRTLLETLAAALEADRSADGAVYASGERRWLLPLALRRRALPAVTSQLDAGRLRLGDVLDLLKLVLLPPRLAAGGGGPDMLVNVNRPDDLAAFDRPIGRSLGGPITHSTEERREP